MVLDTIEAGWFENFYFFFFVRRKMGVQEDLK
jgi:hypothetical protein